MQAMLEDEVGADATKIDARVQTALKALTSILDTGIDEANDDLLEAEQALRRVSRLLRHPHLAKIKAE